MAHLPTRLPGRAAVAGRVTGSCDADDAARRTARPVAGMAGGRVGGISGRRQASDRRLHGARRVADGHLVSAGAVEPGPAALPRSHRDRARIARGRATGPHPHHRTPRTARVPRPARDAARAGVRPRPPVHVAVLHHRFRLPARRHHGAARLGAPGPGRPDGLRHPVVRGVVVATGCGAPGGGGQRGPATPGPSPPSPWPPRPPLPRRCGCSAWGHR